MSKPVTISPSLGITTPKPEELSLAKLGELVRVELLASARLELPGFRGSIDGVGAAITLGLGIEAGTPRLIARPEPRAPSGMSVELTLPVVSGGGYLAISDKALRGALAADLGVIRASGFAILTTDKFSLLVLLAAEFTPPLQLSFGFTLVGVGGIVGINRRLDIDALRNAVGTGDLSRLLFPRDPIGEAPQLLATLDGIFPAAESGFVVGPMLKVGWGTPTIIAATLGVIVDAGNGRVAIVGRVVIALPAEAFALIRIEAIVLGTADAYGVAIDGSLVDSYIIGMPIAGDIRICIRSGPAAVFAISAGGFHPAFTPPAGMEGMRRLSIDMSPAPILRLGLQAYLAITSSAVMFGARVDLQAGFDGFGVRGHAAFDALISFDPFYFVAHIEASVSVTCADFDVASVSLSGDLSGPAPWSIRGHASISILFWDVDIDLPELTWGPDAPESEAAADPLMLLEQQIGRPENWLQGSVAVPHLVDLRPGAADGVVVHPLASVEFRQTAIPLDTPIVRVDGRRLAAPAIICLTTPGVESRSVPGAFVPVRFFDLDATAAMAAAGTVDLPAGRVIGALDPRCGRVSEIPLVYEQKILMDEAAMQALLQKPQRFLVPYADLRGDASLAIARAPKAPAPVEVFEHHAVLAGRDLLRDATNEWADAAAVMAGADDGLGVQRQSLLDSVAAGTSDAVVAGAVMAAFGGSLTSSAGPLQVVAAWEVAGVAG